MLRQIIFSFLFLVHFPFTTFAQNKKYDIVAIGEAMVDIVAFVSEEDLIQLKSLGIKKSDTSRINLATTKRILNSLKTYQRPKLR